MTASSRLLRMADWPHAAWRPLLPALLFVPALACASANSPQENALDLAGSVMLDNRTAVAGAIVTVTDARDISDSVYTDMQGHWRLQTAQLQLPVTVRTRAGTAYADSSLSIASYGSQRLDLVVHKHSPDFVAHGFIDWLVAKS